MEQIYFADLADKLEEIGFMDIYRNQTKKLAPSYFINNPHGIHGIQHAKRVLILSLIFSYLNKLSLSDTEILINAALYHDIGRCHEGVCLEHGILSYKRMEELDLISISGDENTKILKYIVENHCLQDDIAYSNAEGYEFKDQEKAVELLKILKDSDGLDRVRIGDLDVGYLRNEYSARLVTLAQQLLNLISKNMDNNFTKS